jgi:multimeric flavodoxin WrbA
MKVLGIVCSPRKGGNTEIMVREALAAAREAGAETEIILVADKEIRPCESCYACFETGVCRNREDDMGSILSAIEAADGILFGSPVYFHSVSAQAKMIMDRTFSFLQRMKLSGKVAAPVLALRRYGAGLTRNLLYGYFLAHGMVPVRGAVGYGREKGEVRTSVGASRDMTAMEEARNAGMEVVRMVESLAKSR